MTGRWDDNHFIILHITFWFITYQTCRCGKRRSVCKCTSGPVRREKCSRQSPHHASPGGDESAATARSCIFIPSLSLSPVSISSTLTTPPSPPHPFVPLLHLSSATATPRRFGSADRELPLPVKQPIMVLGCKTPLTMTWHFTLHLVPAWFSVWYHVLVHYSLCFSMCMCLLHNSIKRCCKNAI